MMARKDSELTDLRQAVEHLADLVRVLTDAVDDLTEEIQWRNRQSQDGAESPRPFALRSMPLDPCAENWEINRVEPSEVARLRQEVTLPGYQGTLFE